MSSFVKINEANFDQQISQSTKPVLLEFGAVWCKPCKSLEPILLNLGNEWGSRIILAKIDVDEYPDIAASFGVMTVPTLILFVQGEVRERLIGLSTVQKITSTINPYL